MHDHHHHDHHHEEKPNEKMSPVEAKLAAIVEVVTRRAMLLGIAAAALAPEHAHGYVSQQAMQLNKLIKGLDYLSPGIIEEISLVMETNEANIGSHYGAQLVARAWVDPNFMRLLLDDATQAIKTFPNIGVIDYQLIAVQNTDTIHNLIVCTPCGCYPIEILGLTPLWYKSPEYRTNAVSNPNSLLTQFGTTIPANVNIAVWDSDRDRRYLVIPKRPSNTVGWTETQLAALVTRDVMIGTALIPPQ